MAYNKVIFGDDVLIDLTSDTVTAETLLKGFTAHAADGTIVTGTASSVGDNERDIILADGIPEEYVYRITGDTSGYKLVETFNSTFTSCTSVLYDSSGATLGEGTKTYSSDGSTTMTVVNSSGLTMKKTVSGTTCTVILLDSTGSQVAKIEKTYSSDNTVVTTTVTYGS